MNDLPGGMTASPGWNSHDTDDCIVCELHEEWQEMPSDGTTEDGETACSLHDGWLPCGHGHYHAPDEECERGECAPEEDEVEI